MLSHPDRRDRIYVFTVDRALAADLRDRISSDPTTRDYELIVPENAPMDDTVAAIEEMAQDTVSAKLLILDVQSHTMPKLRHAYNKIVGYNRRDLNHLCHIILIVDGPRSLFGAGKPLDVFAPHLADHRLDYHPAAFFFDPFLHYENEERGPVGDGWSDQMPKNLPRRLAAGLQQGDMSVGMARRYFRAASLSGSIQENVGRRRQKMLAELFDRKIAKEFPHHEEVRQSWMCKEGYGMTGEPLKLHAYPFFFEEWVRELMQRTRQTALRGVHP